MTKIVSKIRKRNDYSNEIKTWRLIRLKIFWMLCDPQNLDVSHLQNITR